MFKVALCILLWGLNGVVTPLMAQDNPLSEEMQQEAQKLEQGKKRVEETRAATTHKEIIILCDYMEADLEAKSLCFKQNEEVDIRICMDESVQKLAQNGNFVAQVEMARLYQNKQKNELALNWYKKALENPNMPKALKYELLDDIEKIEEQLKQTQPQPDEIKETLASLGNMQEDFRKQKRKAEILEDKEGLVILDQAENLLHQQQSCYQLKEILEVELCYLKHIKESAQKGNFIAQHQLGNIYENSYENKAMAIKWYHTALKNPQTPADYKTEIEKDLQRVRSKTMQTEQQNKPKE